MASTIHIASDMCAVTAFLLGFMNKKPSVIIIEEHLQCCLHLPAMQQRGPKTAMRCVILPPPRDIDNGTTSVRGHYVHATSRGTLEFWPLHKGNSEKKLSGSEKTGRSRQTRAKQPAGFRRRFTTTAAERVVIKSLYLRKSTSYSHSVGLILWT